MTVTGSAWHPGPAPRPADEERRLAAVDPYQILDTPPDGTFDKVAALAARIFRTPAAAITTAHGYHLGTVNVLDTQPRQVTAEQLAALQNLAALVMDQLEMRLSAIRTVTAEQQMRTAAERLARTLLPPALPQVPGLSAAAAYHAASADEVGGDFYDLFPLDDGRWAFFLGDVCGKEAEAAALTSLTRYTLRAAAIYDPDPCAVLANLDTVLKGEYQGTDPRHCTAVFGILEPTEDGSFTLTLADGGHPPALAVRADGTIQPLPVTGGQLIGLLPEPRFTEEGLAAHLAAGTWDDADDLVAGIRRLLNHLGTGVNDDTALLALSVPIHPHLHRRPGEQPDSDRDHLAPPRRRLRPDRHRRTRPPHLAASPRSPRRDRPRDGHGPGDRPVRLDLLRFHRNHPARDGLPACPGHRCPADPGGVEPRSPAPLPHRRTGPDLHPAADDRAGHRRTALLMSSRSRQTRGEGSRAMTGVVGGESPRALGDNRLMTTSDAQGAHTEPLPVISLSGEFDMHNVTSLEAQIGTMAVVHGGLVLDASCITFADSSFLRMILAVHQRTDLRIAAPSPRVLRLFDLAGVETYLRIYPTLDAARAL